jgi:hypothetical protein
MIGAEFHAKVIDGKIEIPQCHRDRFQGSVKVILLADEEQTTADAIASLLANPLIVPGFSPMTREEIHER